VIAPALAGPLDLGTLVVRLPVDLDPRSGRVEISGRLPATQQGMRLGLRGLTLDIDRPGFIVNTSGCAKRSIDGTIDGDAGAKAKVSAPFRIAGCAKLGFKPALSMMIQGGEEAARHAAHPGLLARIAPRGGDAGIARAAITLPLAQQLDPARLGSVCPATALSPQSRCPALGSVSMRSPALAKPLRGELFMRSSKHRFPDLVAELGGEVDLELDARMSFAGGRVRIVFDSLPDVPLSRHLAEHPRPLRLSGPGRGRARRPKRAGVAGGGAAAGGVRVGVYDDSSFVVTNRQPPLQGPPPDGDPGLPGPASGPTSAARRQRA
jgi:hypothetical protein